MLEPAPVLSSSQTRYPTAVQVPEPADDGVGVALGEYVGMKGMEDVEGVEGMGVSVGPWAGVAVDVGQCVVDVGVAVGIPSTGPLELHAHNRCRFGSELTASHVVAPLE